MKSQLQLHAVVLLSLSRVAGRRSGVRKHEFSTKAHAFSCITTTRTDVQGRENGHRCITLPLKDAFQGNDISYGLVQFPLYLGVRHAEIDNKLLRQSFRWRIVPIVP